MCARGPACTTFPFLASHLTHLQLEEAPFLLHFLCDFGPADFSADHPVELGVLLLLLLYFGSVCEGNARVSQEATGHRTPQRTASESSAERNARPCGALQSGRPLNSRRKQAAPCHGNTLHVAFPLFTQQILPKHLLGPICVRGDGRPTHALPLIASPSLETLTSTLCVAVSKVTRSSGFQSAPHDNIKLFNHCLPSCPFPQRLHAKLHDLNVTCTVQV